MPIEAGGEEVLSASGEQEAHFGPHGEFGLHPSSQSPVAAGDIEILVPANVIEVCREPSVPDSSEEVGSGPYWVESIDSQIPGVPSLLGGSIRRVVDEDFPSVRCAAWLHGGSGQAETGLKREPLGEISGDPEGLEAEPVLVPDEPAY